MATPFADTDISSVEMTEALFALVDSLKAERDQFAALRDRALAEAARGDAMLAEMGLSVA